MTPAEWLMLIAVACQSSSGSYDSEHTFKRQLTCQKTVTKCVFENTEKTTIDKLWVACLEKAK